MVRLQAFELGARAAADRGGRGRGHTEKSLPGRWLADCEQERAREPRRGPRFVAPTRRVTSSDQPHLPPELKHFTSRVFPIRASAPRYSLENFTGKLLGKPLLTFARASTHDGLNCSLCVGTGELGHHFASLLPPQGAQAAPTRVRPSFDYSTFLCTQPRAFMHWLNRARLRARWYGELRRVGF